MICIQTDGEENASEEHNWDELSALVKEKRALGWQFNFMGAGIDAYDQGARMGIAADQTLSYDPKDPAANKAAFMAAAESTRLYLGQVHRRGGGDGYRGPKDHRAATRSAFLSQGAERRHRDRLKTHRCRIFGRADQAQGQAAGQHRRCRTTLLIAAERVRRRARLIEIDGHYVDLIIRRWQAVVKRPATRVSDGQSYDQIAADRDGTEAVGEVA